MKAAVEAVREPAEESPEALEEEPAAEAVAETVEETGPRALAAEPDESVESFEPVDALRPDELAGEPPLREPDLAPDALAAVWVPFHSERSASGFARRLSRALDHPFRVRREGPGAYQVVFAFDAPSQRDALLTRVAALTGEQP